MLVNLSTKLQQQKPLPYYMKYINFIYEMYYLDDQSMILFILQNQIPFIKFKSSVCLPDKKNKKLFPLFSN